MSCLTCVLLFRELVLFDKVVNLIYFDLDLVIAKFFLEYVAFIWYTNTVSECACALLTKNGVLIWLLRTKDSGNYSLIRI